jgi:hypothetical protein
MVNMLGCFGGPDSKKNRRQQEQGVDLLPATMVFSVTNYDNGNMIRNEGPTIFASFGSTEPSPENCARSKGWMFIDQTDGPIKIVAFLLLQNPCSINSSLSFIHIHP